MNCWLCGKAERGHWQARKVTGNYWLHRDCVSQIMDVIIRDKFIWRDEFLKEVRCRLVPS